MNRVIFLFAITWGALQLSAAAQPRLLDDFETLSGWHPIVSDGAKLTITSGEGKTGRAMVMNFELIGVYGYVIAEKELPVDLPTDYQFTFDLKAEIPVNNFEFKLIDAQENVFWIKKLNVRYPTVWEKQRIKKRQISFAWGPAGGGEIHAVKKIQFVVSSGQGGKGEVFIDNFRFEPLDDSAARAARAIFDASSIGKGGEPALDPHGTLLSNWRSSGHEAEWLSIDFSTTREIGGIVVDWDSGRHATSYGVELSDNGTDWTLVYDVTGGNGGRDYLYLPDKETRMVRLRLRACSGSDGYGVGRLEIKRPEFSSHPNTLYGAIAADAPRGWYPKYFLRQQSYWTVVGTSGDENEALINEQGAIEVDKLTFLVEPFLFLDGRLITWNDVRLNQSLENGYLPIPSVEWTSGSWKMTVEAFSAGSPGDCMLIATYRIENRGAPSGKGKLFLALRPFQVNPPWQALNVAGGASRIDSIRTARGVIRVDGKVLIPLAAPDGFGATTLDRGDIVEYLSRGELPHGDTASDRNGFASAALSYAFDVPSGGSAEFQIAVPFHQWRGSPTPAMDAGSAAAYARLAHAATARFWQTKLDKVHITLPPSAQAVINTIKSNIAYIFINRDGPRIQPGSRTYERSWIRDGSLTSTALLELGITDEVREFIDWYGAYQFASGKIPCVVDTRGADPTAEHDSHGEFIYAVMSYFNFTHDTTWLRSQFDRVTKAVRYIASIRAERKTDLYRNGTPEQRACFGLLPESISHEGYWAKPMHSYWDDFFALRGLKDAAEMARLLGNRTLGKEFAAARDDLRRDLYASMRMAMKNAKIDYIPGCAELGDFDATSTTIGVNPANELGNIPEPALHATFDRYFDYFTKRRQNAVEWKDYTPYENRVIGSFVYLGQRQRAYDALQFFMHDRRPQGWNHWAEVVHRDSSAPKYIGDMPHTWCGSDFIRSVRAMFVYERERDTALVLGAGIPEAWLEEPEGVEVRDLPTYYGPLSYSMKKAGNTVRIEASGTLAVPRGGLVVPSPLGRKVAAVTVNGARQRTAGRSEFTIRKLPASIEIRY